MKKAAKRKRTLSDPRIPVKTTTKRVEGGTTYYKDQDGLIHRDGDKPAVIHKNGTKEWYVRGKRHRVGGPAVLYPNGTKVWCEDGERHRNDGPAVEYPDGTCEWRYKGQVCVDVKDYAKKSNLPGEALAIFILKYGR